MLFKQTKTVAGCWRIFILAHWALGVWAEIFSLHIQFRYFWKVEKCSYLAKQKYSKIELTW